MTRAAGEGRSHEKGGDLPALADEAVVQAVHLEFSGPLPHPQLLGQYNEAVPDGAERIVRLVEDQAHHRQALESRGQIFGFVLAVISLSGGIGLIALGSSVAALIPLLAAITGLGGMFVYREVQSHRSDRKQ